MTITVGLEAVDAPSLPLRLASSGWCDVKVVRGGESFTALAEGLQRALTRLGGVPNEHRTDTSRPPSKT